MKCPIDDATLVMSDRQGIEIDYCPECRGVWLDRGELDKIVERAGEPVRRDDDRRDRYERHSSPPPAPKKRKGFLSEIFEFGD